LGTEHILQAERVAVTDKEQVIRFSWNDHTITFGQLLEMLGRIPIPPYLNRDSCEEDNTRYQTVYSRVEGSVAAPTAGLHFTDAIMESIRAAGHPTAEVTLHVGAGTFLPVKSDNAALHPMHTEHFSITLHTVEMLVRALSSGGVIAVGTTTVRTLESLPAIGSRIIKEGDPCCHRTIGQWECYHIDDALDGATLLQAMADHMRRDGVQRLDCSTRIMITPPYKWRVVRGMFTNFHQPQSTLLLLVSALIGPAWRDIYRFAADNGFRFLSYGDSSLLIPPSDPCL
ncbi:MAG: S-adenosylmethionine:tRNA ribosyltransferase-isomerase, partial [Rikenellaceae bacterium]|nr:S-adenosylmethionine:tRNA ribosyltransferase-isomerase [Rikenellaceae bacterium]